MAQGDITTIAETYAGAILELASEGGRTDALEEELADFVRYLDEDADFRAFFLSRVVDDDARCDSLDRLFRGKMSDLLLNSLQVLNKNNRTDIIFALRQQYHELLMKQKGVVEVRVTSALPLSKGLRTRLQQLMESRTGHKVSFDERIDPSVMGGLIVQVGDERIDLTIARKLRRFYDLMIEHASRNIQEDRDLFEGTISMPF